MIKDFKFHSPAPVYFGHETVKNNADLIASYGKRCYITTTRFPAGCYDVLMKNVNINLLFGIDLLLGVLLVWQLDRMGDRRERKGKA